MPEAPAWRFKSVKRVPAPAARPVALVGRVFTGRPGGLIADGFVSGGERLSVIQSPNVRVVDKGVSTREHRRCGSSGGG